MGRTGRAGLYRKLSPIFHFLCSTFGSHSVHCPTSKRFDSFDRVLPRHPAGRHRRHILLWERWRELTWQRASEREREREREAIGLAAQKISS